MKRLFFLVILIFSSSIFLFCNSYPQEKAEGSHEETVDSFARISMIFIGDIMGHDRQIDAAWFEETKTYDYRHCFQYVKPIFTDFDLVVGNLEVTLPGKTPYAGYPQFKSPDALAYALKDAGFNVMVTANNHSNDGYGDALVHTIDTLRGLGFYQTGTFKNQEERDSLYPLIVEQNNFKIAFLNYTYGTNGIADEPPTIVNMINRELMQEDIEKAKELEPDLIIALMHWGDEYKLIENDYQRNNAKFLAENGVDLIIGSHPHVLQPVRYISAGENDSTLTVFSLGNYISNQRRINTDGGMMFEISYRKNIFTNELHKDDFYHHLVWRYRAPVTADHPKGRFFVVPIDRYEKGLLDSIDLSDSEEKAMRAFAERMRNHMDKNSISLERNREREIYDKEIIPADTIDLDNTSSTTYHVQLLASSQSTDEFEAFIIKIIEKEEDGMFKYLSEGHLTRDKAEAVLEQVRNNGYKDAFIVKYKNNKRVIPQ